MLVGLYVVRCYISCLPRLCSVLLHGEKKHKKWFMNINEQAGIPNLKDGSICDNQVVPASSKNAKKAKEAFVDIVWQDPVP